MINGFIPVKLGLDIAHPEITLSLATDRCQGAYDIEILEMELMEEHIHLLVSFPPSRSITDISLVQSETG
jgi:REP element-mobilizing transposase RayT